MSPWSRAAIQIKKTPPCVPQLIAARVARVVAAGEDPNPMVSGEGFRQLRDAGIEVEQGLLAAEAKQLNAAFFRQAIDHLPYVTLKWAQTADGKSRGLADKSCGSATPPPGESFHELRWRCDAIMVGIRTAIADDPLLTTRGMEPPRKLLRIVLDSTLRIPMQSQLVQTARHAPLLICCGEVTSKEKQPVVAELQRLGVEVMTLRDYENHQLFNELLQKLGERGITHLLVEPGARLAKSFIEQGAADRVWIVRSPIVVGDGNALSAAEVDYPVSGRALLDGDELTEYLNPRSPAFFLNRPSADFLLAQGSAVKSR